MIEWKEQVESIERGEITAREDGYGGMWSYYILVNDIRRQSTKSYGSRYKAKRAMLRTVEDMRVTHNLP